MYKKYIKRILDFVLSLIALIVLSPVFLILAVLVRIKLGKPIIFKQRRPGKNEKIFMLYKFRTMTDAKDEQGNLLPDSERLTKFGKFLRSTSLDELPELVNILKGDMSIVGPRPMLVRDMVFFDKKIKRRQGVMPGLTGWAQANGRNSLTWDARFKYDLYYVDNLSLMMDIKTIFLTIKAVIKRQGIGEDGGDLSIDYGDYLLKYKRVTKKEYDEKQQEAKDLLNGIKPHRNNKSVLIVASVVSFIEWFNKENIDYLKNKLKCNVHIACNFDYMDDTDEMKTRAYIETIKNKGIKLHNINFARNPISKQNIKAYKELKYIIDTECFNLIHCHTPTVSIMTRLASKKARKKGTIVMYTCHGFHFHNASSKKNWLIYYPIEKYCSRFCDYIVTINKEDFNRAKKFHAKSVRYIPGVGVDINKIKNISIDKIKYKESIGVPRDCILILSIGEMIERKNHEIIIKALGKINNNKIYYAIAGKGPLKDYLEKLAKENNVNLILLGFRKDIPELCNVADISTFPSKIEGLGLAGIEAMAAGVPLISSNVHGILDYVIDGKTGYTCDPNDVDEFVIAINKLVNSEKERNKMKTNCLKAVEPFEINNALHEMWKIYDEILIEREE